ncbi:MAG: hypothetical protein HYZ42_02595 [Bacteroidetes bacterium]|nr:hypothetical protein [Bacteroidota bacterium]
MTKYIKHIFLLAIFSHALSVFASDIHSSFIQNKGQLDNLVLYEKILPNGSLFIENGKFKYIYYDEVAWRKIVSHPKLDHHSTKAKTLNFHTIIVDFIGANFSKIEEKEKAQGYLNYYIVSSII